MTVKTRRIAYWATTGFAAIALSAVGAAEVLRVPVIMDGLAHLGYPAYFATILGTWLLFGSAAIMAPGLSRVKEWAYAGMFFTLTGAALSHSASGDAVGRIFVPILVLGAVVASWALQPARQALVATGFAAPRAA
jgi:DoxX-like family